MQNNANQFNIKADNISLSGRRWQRRPDPSPTVFGKLKSEFQTNEILLDLLARRGVTGLQEAYNFFLPTLDALHSPSLLKDIDLALTRIHQSIILNETIVVYGDYDVDGTTAVALMYSFLINIHDKVVYYIPDRFTEGYGITKEGINAAKELNAKLIISLDCGIKSNQQIDYANGLGIDFIIGDHHTVGDELPNAIAVLNPKRPDCEYPYKELSGCGISYKLAEAYAEKYNIRFDPAKYLDLVAISVAADLVPMTGENRIMSYHGLQLINNNPRPGIKALIELSKIKHKIDVSDLVFRIGPRINAAGRVSSGKLAVQMLVEESLENAIEIAETINQKNTDRQNVDQTTTRHALAIMKEYDLVAKKSIVLYQEDWHQGVIGIVASRLIEKYHRPTVLLTRSNGHAIGSARAIPGFDMYAALQQVEGLLEQWGGHKAAAGLTLKLENISEFELQFEKVVSESINTDILTPLSEYDLEISLTDITLGFAKNIVRFGPFGPDNPKPTFVIKRLSCYDKPQIISGKHTRCTVVDEQGNLTRIIGYGLSNISEHIYDNIFDICFTVELNEHRGMFMPLISVKDFRLHQIQTI
ncbi:MAG: single-stranded-DNA-specific exonuclease RecJ [Bacteroidota bacterium]|nr:single-stranded-DNA-specific exonuclease RecJ [Bacteroidota bacterium]